MLLERLGDGTEGESREFFETPLREVIRSMLIIRDQMASSGMLRSAPTVPDPAPEERAGHWDELVRVAAELCIQNGGGSTKLLQRRLGLSFAQAAQIIDQLSDTGVIGPADGRKERAVLVTPPELDQIVGPH